MLNVLVKWLTPIFEGMGVSPTDVQTYVEMLGGYIYAIVGLFVLAVAVMIAAHWIVKKGTRHVVRWGAGVSWVLIVTVLANVICFGPMYNNLAPILNTRASVSEESIAKSLETIEEVGAEGMALVKNENHARAACEGFQLECLWMGCHQSDLRRDRFRFLGQRLRSRHPYVSVRCRI